MDSYLLWILSLKEYMDLIKIFIDYDSTPCEYTDSALKERTREIGCWKRNN